MEASLDSRTRGIGRIPTSTAGGGKRTKLDRRRNDAKFLAALIASVEQELGPERLGIAERGHVEGYAGTCLLLQNLNARLAAGERLDSEHTEACKVMVHFASLLGLSKQQTGDTDGRSALHST
jgi:hypothetical protein